MSDDLISRQNAIDALGEEPEVWLENDDYELGLNNQWHYDVNALMAVPSAQRWISVSERLPKNDDWVIVTILDERGDTPWRYTDFGWYLEEANCWIVDAEQRKDVVAWMSLPEPWKKEKQ